MANEENLKKGHPIRTKEEARRRGRNGGLKRTPAKKLASRLRELKKKGLSDDMAKKLADFIEDPQLGTLQVLTWLERWKKDCKTPGEANALAKSLINLLKLRHGEQKPAIQLNIQNNLYMSKEDRESKIKDMLDLDD